jgi:type I restriction enzyme S subunit
MSENAYASRPICSAVFDHVGGGTPPRQVPSYWKGNIPWASVKDFPEQAGFITDTQEHISAAGLNASASNLIPAGTPLVCTRMAVGRAAMPSVPMAINQDVKALFPAAGVSAAYLLRLLQFIRPRAEAQAVGSTVKGIRILDYLDIVAPIADTTAQPVIAAILDTLDTAIRETEAIIVKLRAVKQGLLQDLLTCGLDGNGEPRAPHAEAPDLYKDSPLGWIPIEWEVGTPAKWCSKLTVGVVNAATQAYATTGTPFIRSQNVRPNQIVLDDVLYISSKFNHQQRKSILRTNDVVVVRTGYPGTAAVVPPELDGSNCFSLVIARPLATRLDPNFLSLYLNSELGKSYVARLQFGSAQHNFNVGEMRKLIMVRPDLFEQRSVLQVVADHEIRERAEERALAKLRAVKIGLMDDLLTGRVRITPLLAEAKPEKKCT